MGFFSDLLLGGGRGAAHQLGNQSRPVHYEYPTVPFKIEAFDGDSADQRHQMNDEENHEMLE